MEIYKIFFHTFWISFREGSNPICLRRRWIKTITLLMALVELATCLPTLALGSLQLHIKDHYVVMDNGLVEVTLSKPGGLVTGIKYNGIDNLLEIHNKESQRGYWDVVWSAPTKGTMGYFNKVIGTKCEVVVQNEDQIEVSFTTTWDPWKEGRSVPLNIDKRFVLLSGSSGFYTYAIYEHLKEWPAFQLDETRIAFKLRKDKFHYMAIADNRQRFMPRNEDRNPDRCRTLAFREAVHLVNPIEPEFKGEVDDKYQYSSDTKDIGVHGWISTKENVGFWLITPSNEFRAGGPLKQHLTSHVGPTALTMFLDGHYTGEDLVPRFKDGEHWKKVFGPVFIYLNSVRAGDNPFCLWENAKQQLEDEVQSWPYSFPASEDFPKSYQRGKVVGRLLVQDRYLKNDSVLASGAYVGLALPGEAGSWQRESKGYQFWTRADESGSFSINHIHPGYYNLYAWVPGFIGDYRYESLVNIIPGSYMNVSDLVYYPPRNGPTLWEIGIPDRSAKEFYVPDPNPNYINKLYVNHPDRFRQYGLWERYTELYPYGDLIYTIGSSNYSKDWFFAQVTRSKNNSYVETTWQIRFKLYYVDWSASYKLRVAIASASLSRLQVRINNQRRAHFETDRLGEDNTIARHGIHGLYWLFNIDIQGSLLVQGDNTIYLRTPKSHNVFQGIMYDYLRLEGPGSPVSSVQILD